MTMAITDDRLAHLLMFSAADVDYPEARKRLDRAAFILTADACAGTPWGQAALLTVAECGVRMFPGGVYLGQSFDELLTVGHHLRAPLKRHLVAAGCRTELPPPHASTLHVGTNPGSEYRGLRCWADDWGAVVSSNPSVRPPVAGNEISGVLAGALGVSDLFRSVVLGDRRAPRRTQTLSTLAPGVTSPISNFRLRRLPAAFWLLGLGNLGQAALWTIGLLPYADPGAVTLFLQDTDIGEPGNLPIQILTRHSWMQEKKARAAAQWAETLGFTTTIVEQRFSKTTKRSPTEPSLALVGVDNLPARHAVVSAGFDLVLDAGLGASATEVFDIRIHAFPGARTAEQAWPAQEATPVAEPQLSAPLKRLLDDGLLDRCGAFTIAGRSLGVPSTAVAAAAMQVAQACRAVAESKYCDLIDVALANCRRTARHEFSLPQAGVLPGVEVRNL